MIKNDKNKNVVFIVSFYVMILELSFNIITNHFHFFPYCLNQ